MDQEAVEAAGLQVAEWDVAEWVGAEWVGAEWARLLEDPLEVLWVHQLLLYPAQYMKKEKKFEVQFVNFKYFLRPQKLGCAF